MGNGNTRELYKPVSAVEKAEMVIDKENKIYVCVIPEKHPSDTPYSSQALKLGSGYLMHIYRLENFTENINSLVYEFEHDYKLSVTKRMGEIYLRLTKDNNVYHKTKMDMSLRKQLHSPFLQYQSMIELNRLYDFIVCETRQL